MISDAARLYQTDFPPEEFAARRDIVFDRIGDEACAVLQGAAPPRGFDPIRQTNQFFYLCGVDVPQAYLLLDARERKTVLYLPHHDAAHAASEGDVLSVETADLTRKLTGVDEVRGPEDLEADLRSARMIYTPHKPAEGKNMSRDVATSANRKIAADPWDGRPTREGAFIGLLLARCPNVEVRDLSPIIDEMRVVKSELETEMCRRAGRLTGLAVMEAMRSTQPGVIEYQFGAIAQYIYLSNGARGEGYRAIIAGGTNAWYGHYFRNNCPLQDGDLVLMDVAPDYAQYTSDIGRMWPVNGTYDALQRELYGFVVEYHKALLERIRPGVLVEQIHAETAEAMVPVIDGQSWSKPIYEEAARRMLDFRGHLSHPVGMAVHDVGPYQHLPLEPGMVFTVDPQMWVHEEKRYVRCEDTVVVTPDGIENLTGFVPLELDDCEALMQEEGLLQSLPPNAFD